MLTSPFPVQIGRCARQTWLVARFAVLAGSAGQPLAAAGGDATTMSPFRVEAEFGVDGLRIQNSTSVLNPYLLGEHGVGQLQDISGVAPNLSASNSDTRGFGDVLGAPRRLGVQFSFEY